MVKADFKIVAIVVTIIAVGVIFMQYGGETILGLESTDTLVLIELMPGVFVLLVAFYGVSIGSGPLLAGSVTGGGSGPWLSGVST